MDPSARPRPNRQALFSQLLSLLLTGRLIDLGTGHGTFAVLAADLGWEVTAVDARTERWPDDRRVTWVQGDIRAQKFEEFDVVACLACSTTFTVRSRENKHSFWPTLASFHTMLARSGYSTVLTVEPWVTGDRTFFLALPRPAQ